MKDTTSIVVASTQPSLLRAVLRPTNMTVLAGCSNGIEAIQAISLLKPTVAVLDLLLPDLTGPDVLARVFADRCATKVVLLTTNYQQAVIAFGQGAKGVVLKSAAPLELLECIRRVAAGGHWLPSGLVESALERDTRSRSADQLVFESLTKREQQIVVMVSNGLSNKDVGRRLDLSEGTVKVHLHNIYRKLGVSNRTALAAMAVTCGEHLQRPVCALYREPQPPRRGDENRLAFRMPADLDREAVS